MLGGQLANGNASTGPSSIAATPGPKDMDVAVDIPSIDEQLNIIKRQIMASLEDGAVGYAVSASWISRVFARSSEKEDHEPYEKDVLEGDVGPLDNSSILLSGK